MYIAPHQWSFPLDLPVQTFGIFPTGVLIPGEAYPWGAELDFRIFTANLAQGAGPWTHPSMTKMKFLRADLKNRGFYSPHKTLGPSTATLSQGSAESLLEGVVHCEGSNSSPTQSSGARMPLSMNKHRANPG